MRNNCKYIGEFPSCRGTSKQVEANRDIGIRIFPEVKHRCRQTVSSETALQVIHRARLDIRESFQLSRQKATEFLPFLLTTTDRHFNPETGSAIPFGYILRGPSLSMQTMRNIAEDFHNNCHENGIHIPVKTFDGQWINIVHRDADGRPLTEMQFAKDHHKQTGGKDKATIIRDIAHHFTASSTTGKMLSLTRMYMTID